MLERLARVYAGAQTALHYENSFQLLIAVILSAQCTDARVNMVTPALFKRFPTAASLARATPRQVEPLIKSCGFFRVKSRNIVNAARGLVERFDGKVPATMEDLLTLPGVGRKTASVILAVAFQAAAIAVDTHVFRVANRLRLIRAKNPQQAEQQLMKVVPRNQWVHVSHWLIDHGRRICHARKPECLRCPVAELCPSAPIFIRTGVAAGTEKRRKPKAGRSSG